VEKREVMKEGILELLLAFRHIWSVAVERESMAQRDFAKTKVIPDTIECSEFV
jgi:hypothetical protein